jgi:hypothetical protein
VRTPPPDVLLLHEWPRVPLGADELGQLRAFLERHGQLEPADDEECGLDFHRLRNQSAVGSTEALDLVQLVEPGLVLCGHVHVPLRASIRGPKGPILLRALAKIDAGLDAVALFRWKPATPPVEIEGWRPGA